MDSDPTRRNGWTSVPLLMLSLALASCGTTRHEDATTVCRPTPGMTADQLTACGCFQAGGRGNAALVLEDSRGTVDNVTIVNYLCPRGAAGIVKVLVVNGVARETRL